MKIKKDYSGCWIGGLYIIKEIQAPYRGKESNRKTIRKLECKCLCGNIFYPYKGDVITKRSTQCMNCARVPFKIGDKIDHLTVLERDRNRIRGYICLCECGNKSSVLSRYLSKGKSPKRCEKCRYFKKYSNKPKLSIQELAEIRAKEKHYKSMNEKIGKKFGNLKVLSFDKWENCPVRRRAWYRCKCICKNIIAVRGDHLKYRKSCGCISRGKKGPDNWKSNFTKDQVLAIRELKKTGMYTQREISKMYNANETTISSIVLKKTYRNV
jgi:hypothetical protein